MDLEGWRTSQTKSRPWSTKEVPKATILMKMRQPFSALYLAVKLWRQLTGLRRRTFSMTSKRQHARRSRPRAMMACVEHSRWAMPSTTKQFLIVWSQPSSRRVSVEACTIVATSVEELARLVSIRVSDGLKHNETHSTLLTAPVPASPWRTIRREAMTCTLQMKTSFKCCTSKLCTLKSILCQRSRLKNENSKFFAFCNL